MLLCIWVPRLKLSATVEHMGHINDTFIYLSGLPYVYAAYKQQCDNIREINRKTVPAMVSENKMHRKLSTIKFKRIFAYTFFIVLLG